MRCERLDHLLPAYIDGDLSGRVNERVSEHLDRCERCRQELAMQQRVLRALDGGRRPVAIDLWSDFSRRLAESGSTRPSPVTRSIFSRAGWRLPSPVARLLWQPGLATALAAMAVALIARSGPELPPVPVRVDSSDSMVQIARAPAQQLGAREPAEQPISSREVPGDRASEARPDVRAEPRKQVSPLQRPTRRRNIQVVNDAAPATERGDGPRRSRAGTERRSRGVRFVHVAHVPTDARPAIQKASSVLKSAGQEDPPTYSLAARTGTTHLTTSDPLNIAEALVAAQQDAANDQMAGELLRLAQEVVRVSGEPAADAAATDGSRT